MAQKRDVDFVFDTTGRNYCAVKDLIYWLNRKKRYKIVFAVVWSSLETCLASVAIRNLNDHSRAPVVENIVRVIYEDFLKGSASKLLRLPTLSTHTILLYDNNSRLGNELRLLYKKEGVTVDKKTNKDGVYDMNIRDIADGQPLPGIDIIPYPKKRPRDEEEACREEPAATVFGSGLGGKRLKTKRKKTQKPKKKTTKKYKKRR